MIVSKGSDFLIEVNAFKRNLQKRIQNIVKQFSPWNFQSNVIVNVWGCYI